MKNLNLIYLLVILGLFSGCKSCKYSLTGVNIPPDVKNMSIQYFTNEASYVNPTISQRLTEQLKDKFLRETSLAVIANEGDYRLSGSIIEYKTEPVATNTQTGATKNRFTITIKTIFECPKHTDLNFTQNFTGFTEFDASQNFQAVEARLSEDVLRQIIQEVYNKIALKW